MFIARYSLAGDNISDESRTKQLSEKGLTERVKHFASPLSLVLIGKGADATLSLGNHRQSFESNSDGARGAYFCEV